MRLKTIKGNASKIQSKGELFVVKQLQEICCLWELLELTRSTQKSPLENVTITFVKQVNHRLQKAL
uniref:Uncharacterized protein n=1 Tax=Ascaris lumbricoides TaxID=6252 RepID=A0A0M3ID78_ASCLU